MRSLSPIPACPERLFPRESPGARERARAIAHFTAEDWEPTAKFTFSAYSHEEISAALRDAFDGVCAYCEAPLASVVIEHYRPKGAVRTGAEPQQRGYYWLAATWENLLPSCHSCNTDLWTEHVDEQRRKAGKGTWFPLEDESARATQEGEEEHERPLLLHPYYDEPADHLEFVEDGVVSSRRAPDGTPSLRGETTVGLLGLNRRGLPEARRDRLIVLEVTSNAALEAERRWRADPDDEELAAEYQRCVAELEKLLQRGAGYSALAAQHLGLTGATAISP